LLCCRSEERIRVAARKSHAWIKCDRPGPSGGCACPDQAGDVSVSLAQRTRADATAELSPTRRYHAWNSAKESAVIDPPDGIGVPRNPIMQED
jgi:hypothetical protein